MVTILFRTLIIYVCLIATLRFMGKRQLGELEVSELVTTLLLSEIASLPVTNQDIPISYALIPIFTLVALEVSLSALLLKCPWLKKILSTRPTFLIDRGRLDAKMLRSVRISVDELMSQLRQKDVFDLDEVEYAILEPNGQISIVPKATARTVTTSDMNLHPKEHGMMHLIVADGIINQRNLACIGKDEAWVKKTLRKNGHQLNEILLMTADDALTVRIVSKQASEAGKESA